VDEVLELVDLVHVRHARPPQLSGGEAARAGLAVAVSGRPAILLADEPTGEVDSETEQRILHLLDHYRKDDGAVIMVTHSEAAAACADRTVQLLDGRIVNGT
jgi:putative ABC transport system ATP-binding protein